MFILVVSNFIDIGKGQMEPEKSDKCMFEGVVSYCSENGDDRK
jgi:hypothetical protein